MEKKLLQLHYFSLTTGLTTDYCTIIIELQTNVSSGFELTILQFYLTIKISFYISIYLKLPKWLESPTQQKGCYKFDCYVYGMFVASYSLSGV